MRALSEGLFDAIVCPSLLDELTNVLARPKIAARVAPDDARGYMEWLVRIAILEDDPDRIARVSADPGDDCLLALAAVSRAQAIVSGDAHLLALTDHDPRVLAPAVFARLVESLR
jgi:predicted nucleic acid-binding protein